MDTLTEWTPDDQMLAHASGWGIFDNSDHGIQIERLDDSSSIGGDDGPTFESDEEALMHVESAAAAGDLLARKAIAYIALNGNYSATRQAEDF